MRIVSLLPSATEILCSLGLGEQLVGVTHECDHPDWVRRLPRVTRTLIPTDAPSAASTSWSANVSKPSGRCTRSTCRRWNNSSPT